MRLTLRMAHHAFAILVLSALVGGLLGCAALGLPVADTFNEKLATGYGTVTTVRVTATQLLDAKKLKAEDGQNVLEQTDNARVGLDIARAIHTSDPDGANSKLSSVLIGLNALAVYLDTRSK